MITCIYSTYIQSIKRSPNNRSYPSFEGKAPAGIKIAFLSMMTDVGPLVPILLLFLIICGIIAQHKHYDILPKSSTGECSSTEVPEDLALVLENYLSQHSEIKEENAKFSSLIERLRDNLTELADEVNSSRDVMNAQLRPIQDQIESLRTVHTGLQDSIADIRTDIEAKVEAGYSSGDDNEQEDGTESHGADVLSEEDDAVLSGLWHKLDDLEGLVQSFLAETNDSDDDNDPREGNESVCKEDVWECHPPPPMTISKPDFAQRGAGASVVTSLTTQTYNPSNVPFRRVLQLLGIYTGYGFPEDALSVSTALGQCWPMKGHNGFLAIRLARPVLIDAISIDHVPQEEAIDMSSALREFKVFVYGPGDDLMGDGDVLLDGVYDATGGEAVQTFDTNTPKLAQVVRLYIANNHGNEEYTCLYRLRVHGERQEV